MACVGVFKRVAKEKRDVLNSVHGPMPSSAQPTTSSSAGGQSRVAIYPCWPTPRALRTIAADVAAVPGRNIRKLAV
jgi:hypothetical protein